MSKHIQKVTEQIINRIWNNGAPNKATLAALRTSSSILGHNASEIWPLLLSSMSEDDLSKDGQPTYAEKAVYVALRCYAIYQQGNDTLVYGRANDTENAKGDTFFNALAILRKNDETRKAIDRRVQIVLGNSNFRSLENSSYHLISILKGKVNNEQIDFAQFAQDLYYFQMNSDMSRQICLKWGQQYYWTATQKDN